MSRNQLVGFDIEGINTGIQRHNMTKKRIITEELIKSYETEKGGYLQKDLKMLGVEWPPLKGWKSRIIGNEVKVTESEEPK